MQVLTGENLKQSRFGWALQVLDFNLDGVDDLVVGAPLACFRMMMYLYLLIQRPIIDVMEKVYVYFGARKTGLKQLSLAYLLRLPGNLTVWVLFLTKDIDLDSHADLLIGAPYSPINVTSPLTGTVYAIKSAAHTYMGNKSEFDVSQAAYSEINGSAAYDLFGTSMSVDTNRLYVGAPGYRNSQARIKGAKGTVGCVYGYNLPLKSNVCTREYSNHTSLTVGWRASFGRVWIQYGSAIRPRLFGCWRTSINFKYECETGRSGVCRPQHICNLWGVLCCSMSKFK